jgi:hypothetical protein
MDLSILRYDIGIIVISSLFHVSAVNLMSSGLKFLFSISFFFWELFYSCNAITSICWFDLCFLHFWDKIYRCRYIINDTDEIIFIISYLRIFFCDNQRDKLQKINIMLCLKLKELGMELIHWWELSDWSLFTFIWLGVWKSGLPDCFWFGLKILDEWTNLNVGLWSWRNRGTYKCL